MPERMDSCPGCGNPMASVKWDGTGWYRAEPCGCTGRMDPAAQHAAWGVPA